MKSYSLLLFLPAVTLLVLSGAQVESAQVLATGPLHGVSGSAAATRDLNPNEPTWFSRGSSAGLVDLMTVGQLQSEFNRDRGSIRILVLMSPT